MTKVEKVGNIYFKRDDLFEYGGMYGAKVRMAKILCEQAKNNGYTTVTTLGAKSSPQINILASVCNELGLKAVGHTTTAPLQLDMQRAKEKGATIIQHNYGYTSVLIKRAKDYAIENNAYYLPFGMESNESVEATAREVKSILPYINQINRIIIPAGSGINLAGVIKGIIENNVKIKVVGIVVGFKGVEKILNKYVGKDIWREYCELVNAKQEYNDFAEYTTINGIEVDSTYEGKCIPFLQKNDLFWLIGKKEKQHKGKELII